MFTFGSLFSGIGGIDLGLKRAGMTCRWQVEKDPFCQKILTKRFPGVTRFGDVRDVGKYNLDPVDLIAGGFPCQPHSLAGKRRGAEDDRNLWPEYCRIIAELHPAWVIGENVPGIITTILDQVLSDLEDSGYETATFVIPACAFGAPHIRERVFVLAHSESIGWERHGNSREGWDGFENGREILNAEGARLQNGYFGARENAQGEGAFRGFERPNWWATEPGMGRVAHGVPHRVDRLRGLGNAVVPQVMEWIGSLILQI